MKKRKEPSRKVLDAFRSGPDPEDGVDPRETLRRVIDDEPVPPSLVNPAVPQELERVCLRCLHKTPDKRYASAAELAEDLRRFQAGETVT